MELSAIHEEEPTYTIMGVETTPSPRKRIYETFISTYKEAAPWIEDALLTRNLHVKVGGKNPGAFSYYSVRRSGWGTAVGLAIVVKPWVINDIENKRPAGVVFHELAHSWTLDGSAAKPSGPVGILWFYLDTILQGKCNAPEILADIIAYHSVDEAFGQHYPSAYFSSCSRAKNRPSEETRAATASVIRGELPKWFYDNYQLEDGALDLVTLWTDIRNPCVR